MEKLNSMVQDARALLKSAQKYAPTDDRDGIDPDLTAALATAIEKAVAADTTQQNSIRDVSRFTAAQNEALDEAHGIIAKQRNAAKGRYTTKDEQMMKEFHVGAPKAQSVKALLTELAYMKGVAEKRVGDLTKHGFKAAHLAALDAAAEKLKQTDASQELAKKAQKAATMARDAAVGELQRMIQKVRSTAKSVFAGQKPILLEFETITRAKPTKKAKASANLSVVEKNQRQANA
jgi:hypothetical protein